MQSSDIISGMGYQSQEQAANLEYAVLNPKAEKAARVAAAIRFIGSFMDEYREFHTPSREAVEAALNLVVEDMESANPTNAVKRASYDFFREFALSHGLEQKAQEYAGKSARLNGVHLPDYQERGGLDIRI